MPAVPPQAAHVRMPKKLIVSLVLLAVASGALSTWFTYTVLQGWHSAEQTTPASGNFAKDDGNRVSSAEENRVAAAAEKGQFARVIGEAVAGRGIEVV